MAVPTDAEVIALVREMFPAITTLIASDTYLEAWLPWARALVGVTAYGTRATLGMALALAHACYRTIAALAGDGGAAGAAGAITSLTTLSLSASFGALSGGGARWWTPTDAELATTRPGSMLLALRTTRPNAVLLAPIG